MELPVLVGTVACVAGIDPLATDSERSHRVARPSNAWLALHVGLALSGSWIGGACYQESGSDWQPGCQIGLAGDADADGQPDLFVLDFFHRWNTSRVGRTSLSVISSASGQVVSRLEPGRTRELLGVLGVQPCGDVNGDGSPDLVVGSLVARDRTQSDFSALVRFYSARDGSELTEFDAGSSSWIWDFQQQLVLLRGPGQQRRVVMTGLYFGKAGPATVAFTLDGEELFRVGGESEALAVAGDLNDDGFEDFFVNTIPSGELRAYSGSDGSALFELEVPAFEDSVWERDWSRDCLSSAGDVDGDGVPEFLVGFVGTFNVSPSGGVMIFSGAGGRLLYSVRGRTHGDLFGRTLAEIGDIDGDGRPDFAVGAPSLYTDESRIALYSGRDGSEIADLGALPWLRGTEHLGQALCSLGDLNGDSHSEIAFSSGASVFVVSAVDRGLLLTIPRERL